MQILTRADVVITSYNIVASEHGSLEALHTAKEAFADDESSDNVLSHKIHSPRKTSTVLFNVEWYRLVLGVFAHLLVFVPRVDGTTRKMKLMPLRIGRARPPLHALAFRRSTDGVLQALQCETFYFLPCETSSAQHSPSQNTIDEMFSFLRCLNIKPLNDWKTFQEKINNPVKCGCPNLAIQRLQVGCTL